MNAVDTNVIAYSVDADGKEKRPKALALLQHLAPAETVIPWQVTCELGSVLTKFVADGRTEANPATVIAAITARFPLALPPEDLVLKGLRLRAAHQLSYWDALLIAACVDAGVTRLYTEDLQSRPVIEGVEIVNPFT
jgi:predicted nucleic acid-binding protein